MCNCEWMSWRAVSLAETCRNLIYSVNVRVWMLSPNFFNLFIPSIVRKTSQHLIVAKNWFRNLCTKSTYEKDERMRLNLGKNTWEQFVVSFSHFCSQSWAYLNVCKKRVSFPWYLMANWHKPTLSLFSIVIANFCCHLYVTRIMSSQG